MGPGQKFLNRVWSNFCCSGWVGSAIFCLGLEKFPLKISNLQFFPFGWKKYHRVRSKSTRVRAGSASYLHRVKSMLGLGQGPSLNQLTLDRVEKLLEVIKVIKNAQNI